MNFADCSDVVVKLEWKLACNGAVSSIVYKPVLYFSKREVEMVTSHACFHVRNASARQTLEKFKLGPSIYNKMLLTQNIRDNFLHSFHLKKGMLIFCSFCHRIFNHEESINFFLEIAQGLDGIRKADWGGKIASNIRQR